MTVTTWTALCSAGALMALASCCQEGTPSVRGWPNASATSPAAPADTAREAPAASASGIAKGGDGAPSVQTLLDAHAAELERLPSLVAGGTLEVRWRDDQGDHFEQGDLDLRFRAPGELSLRLSKVGETQFLGGCNATHWWWFEGWTKPTRLAIGSRRADGRSAAKDAERRGPPIQADELLTLLALRPFARIETDRPAQKRVDGEWIVDLDDRTSPMGLPTRLVFVPAQAQGAVGWTMRSLEVLDAAGTVVLSALYEDHARIERRGVATGDWPVMAKRVTITVPPHGDRTGFEWRIVLDRPSATGERIAERLFDLQAVRAAVRAEVVEDMDRSEP